ncbi:MAG TPA: ornithine cyclodeaminase family protein, partial [Vicinamibacteria bacterium]|nr:ornithine cyclodeaminase family protein [Vicinamibacteria bacterium]
QPRNRIRLNRLVLHVMSAGSDVLGYAGLKCYTTGPTGARFYFLLFDSKGELKAMMQADSLGQIRTGAATAVATRHMAPPEATRVGIYGSGWQARSQIEALAAARTVSQVMVWSRDVDRREKFCDEMEKATGVSLRPASRPEDVAAESEILVTATSSKEPVLLGAWLEPGHHVNAVGSNSLNRREIDEDAVTRADVIAADSVEGAKLECGDLYAVVNAGKLSWDEVQELSEIVVSGFTREPRAITLFASQGIAIEDVAAAKVVYEQGIAEGRGRLIDV